MRGDNTFTVMKGFLDDFTIKGDVTDEANVDEVVEEEAETKKKENPDEGATSMEEDAQEVADGAEEDIEDGYVADQQKSKGWEAYNQKCASGVVFKDYGFNKHNTGSVIKSMEENIVVKAKKKTPPVEKPIDITLDKIKDVGGKIKNTAIDMGSKIGDSATNLNNKAVDAAKRAGSKIGDSATNLNNKVVDAAKRAGSYIANNKGKAALIGGGLIGAGGLAYGGKKYLDAKAAAKKAEEESQGK